MAGLFSLNMMAEMHLHRRRAADIPVPEPHPLSQGILKSILCIWEPPKKATQNCFHGLRTVVTARVLLLYGMTCVT